VVSAFGGGTLADRTTKSATPEPLPNLLVVLHTRLMITCRGAKPLLLTPPLGLFPPADCLLISLLPWVLTLVLCCS